MNLEQKIKDLAKKNSISIRQLCKNIGISENGLALSLKNNSIKLDTLQKIAIFFNVNISYFFDDSVETQENKKELKQENSISWSKTIQSLTTEITGLKNQISMLVETNYNLSKH